MTTSVDVLAVMENCSDEIDAEFGNGSGNDLREVRAAVADLIEAVDKLFGADMEHCMEMDGKDDQLEAVQFAKSALARVKGA